jgi:hypothetical protein
MSPDSGWKETASSKLPRTAVLILLWVGVVGDSIVEEPRMQTASEYHRKSTWEILIGSL